MLYRNGQLKTNRCIALLAHSKLAMKDLNILQSSLTFLMFEG